MSEPAYGLVEVPSFHNSDDENFAALIAEFDSHEDWFWVRKITEEVPGDGCQKIAGYIGVSGRAVRQWREDPVNGSGVVSPINRCLQFLKFVTSFHNPRIDMIVRHLLKPALEQMGVALVSQSQLAALRRATTALLPERAKQLVETTRACDCGNPLQQLGPKGVWWCATCGGQK